MNWSLTEQFLRPLALGCLVAILTMSAIGLLAIWAGAGRHNWFLRSAATLGCISLLLAIPALELVIVYVIQAALTIVALGVWQNWQLARRAATIDAGSTKDARQRLPWQYSIRDMMLLAVLVASLSAMLARVPAAVWANWRALLAEGLVTAGLTVAATWIAFSQGWRRTRIVLVVVLAPVVVMVGWLLLWRRARQVGAGAHPRSWSRSIWQASLVLATVAILAPVASVYWRLANPWPIPTVVLPNPNAYGELLKAGELADAAEAKSSVPFVAEPTAAQLRLFVSQCATACALARSALDKPCQVPPREYDKEFKKSIGDTNFLRPLARAFCFEGRLAAMEGKNKAAIKAYVDTIRLGHVVMRGGTNVYSLVGVTIEGTGRYGIAQMRRSLSAEECVSSISTLGHLLNRQVPLVDCLAREAVWNDHAYGWQGRFGGLIYDIAYWRRPQQSGTAHAYNRELAQCRLLMCELAIRAYSLDHGRHPAALADLAPRYLSDVPKDPFGGGDFVYRITLKGYELHSAGLGLPNDDKFISADYP